MSTVKIIFRLPEDQQEYNRVNKALDMASVLWEFSTNCRKTIESEFENETNVDAYDGIKRCFEHFYELMEEAGINIDDLYS